MKIVEGRTKHTDTAQGSVQFDIPVLGWWQNLQPTDSILTLHLTITRVTKNFGTKPQPLCHFYKLFPCISPLLQVGTSFTPHRCGPVAPRRTSKSAAEAVTAGEQTHSPPRYPSCSLDTHSWRQAVTVWLSLGSLCPVPHPRLWSASPGRPDSLGFIPMHALAPPLLRLTNKEAN